MEFNQSQWLKPYVKFNIHKKRNRNKKNRRRKKETKSGKVLYNLMNNPVYGKTIRNRKLKK